MRELANVELQMKDLQHEHINWFVGACIDYPNYCIVTDYCPKGSLADLLCLDGFHIDKMMLTSMVAIASSNGHVPNAAGSRHRQGHERHPLASGNPVARQFEIK